MNKLEHIVTWEIPNSWCYAKLEDLGSGENAIVDGPFGSNLKVSDYVAYSTNGVPVLTTKNLEGDYSKDSVRYISQNKYEEIKRSKVQPGDILVAKIGSIGKTGIYPAGMKTAIIPANLLKYSVTHSVEFKYVFSYLNFFAFQQFIKIIATATAQPAFNVTKFRKLPIPLPPKDEQHRIVFKSEELFSELDKGIENLKTAQDQLKVYRQALLKHAFEGKLTAKWEAGGKEGSKPKAPKPLAPLITKELAELPELPKEWGWVKVDVYCDLEKNSLKAGPFGSSLKKEFYVKKGYKVYGQEQVISGDWTYGDYFIDEEKYLELESCKVKPFDILISLVGTVGKVLVLPEDIAPGVINPRLVKITPNLKVVVPEFFKYYFESSFLRGLYKLKTHGATMDVLNLGIIQELPFPICSLEEQKRMIESLEARLSEVDQLDQTIIVALQQAEALRQSILKKAFSGQLMPQDPHDEPASALLARIKAEKLSQSENKKGRT